MKMKYILQLFVISMVVLAGACVDDPGNYDYQDIKVMFPVEISDLEDTTLNVLSEVRLEPTVTGLEEGREYEYVWYAYPNNAVGYSPKRDTLGRAKDLQFVMNYPSGAAYSLIYQVKDKQTGYIVSKKITMTGKSVFSTGWFVLKDENEQTDIDFIAPDGQLNSDILFKATGEKMEGKAVKMIYQGGRYYHQVKNEDGTVTLKTNLKAFHVISSRDARVLNPEDISVYKRYPEMFYTPPVQAHPQNIVIASSDLFLIDDGYLRTINGMSANVGKFGYHKLEGEDLDEHILYPEFGSPNCLAFSHKTRSFRYLASYGTQFQDFSEPTPESDMTVSPTNMSADLLKMISRSNTMGWALMKNTEGPEEYYLADLNFKGIAYPFADFDTISPAREFWKADVYGNHFLNSFYFAKGNVLSYYQKNDSDENSIERTDIWPHFGADETISYISQMAKTTGDASTRWNYLVVLTNSPDGWRMYRFTLLGDGVNPEIDQLVEPVYRGQGNARYVMFR